MTYYNHEYSHLIEVKGGIRAASLRGDFGSNWWAKRWIQTLEPFSIGARLSRGRSYARWGQVLSIDIRNGIVEAQAQASRKRPCDVEINVRTIDTDDRERLRDALAEQPVITASLLAGRMSENIEDTFKSVGLSMFPARSDDIESDCSCPDRWNSCQHIAAVYLLLGEEFDRDPYLIFPTRGMDREDLLGDEFRQSAQTIEGLPLAPEPLREDPDVFWDSPLPAMADADLGTASGLDPHADLPQQLGRFPFWQGERELIPALATSTRTRPRVPWTFTLDKNLAAALKLIGAENSTRPSRSSKEPDMGQAISATPTKTGVRTPLVGYGDKRPQVPKKP